MLLVKTKLATSKIHGIGLIADQYIAGGTVVWEHDDIIDRVYCSSKLNSLPFLAHQAILTYGWREGQYYIYPGDNARFINCSKEPNCKINDKGQSVAIRDIFPGEEITEDYSSFDEDFNLYADDITSSD